MAGLEVGNGGNPTVKDCTVRNGKAGGVLVYGQGRGTFDNCELFGNELLGVEIRQGGHPTLKDCKIHDGKQSGVYVHDLGSGTLDNCQIFGNADTAGIESDHPTLDRCDVFRNEWAGVYVSGGGSQAIAAANAADRSNPMVKNCKIHDGKDNGVFVYDQGAGWFVHLANLR